MRDLRKYAKQTNTRLLIGFVILLFIVGDGLIYLIYGPSAAVAGVLCIGAGLIPLIFQLIWEYNWQEAYNERALILMNRYHPQAHKQPDPYSLQVNGTYYR